MLISYLLIINAVAFILMLADKIKARKNLWRIPELVLIGIAVMGGSFGTLIGMYLVRHKTKRLKFSVGIPSILAIQVVFSIILYSLYYKGS